jgi:hypothetical protein
MREQIKCNKSECNGIHKVSSVKNWDDTIGTYVGRCTECNESYNRVWNQEDHNEFMRWMMSDNVIRVKSEGKPYWSSQDSMYRNKFYTLLDAWNYYKKEFLIY